MSCEWRELSLGDVAEVQTGPFGSQLHASDYVNFGIPSIMPQNIGDNIINEDGIARICTEDAVRLKRYLVHDGDIVYSRRGDVEKRALIRQYQNGWLCGTGCLRVRANPEMVYPPYLSYQLGHPATRAWIVQHAHGATMPNLNTDILSQVPIRLPSLKMQQSIASILTTLDDRIELNNRMNKTLEEMAQAIFKSWFVDFSPFADGIFIESEYGEIPAGWKIVTLSDVCSNITDGVHNTVVDDPKGSFYLLSCKNIKDGSLNIDSSERKISAETFQRLRKRTHLSKGDILLSSVGTIGETALLMNDPSNIEFQRSVAIIKPNPQIINSFYLYEALLTKKPEIIHLAHGAVQQCIFIGDIKRFTLIISDKSVMEQYGNLVEPLFQKIEENRNESINLANIRDTLLPRLISGELSVVNL